MSDNIMGRASEGSLDISDEALDARGWQPATHLDDPALADDHEAADDLELDEDEDDELDLDAEDPADPADDGEPASDPPADDAGEGDPEAGQQIPDKFAGKSAEEIARLAHESESYYGKQLAELREQMRQQHEQQLAIQAAQHTPVVDPQSALAGKDPVTQYREALQYVDAGAADPSLIEGIIQGVRKENPDLAFEMARDFDRRLVSAEQAMRLQAVTAPLQQLQQQAFVQTAQQVSTRFADSDPDAKIYENEIAAIVKSTPSLLGDRSQAAIEAGLRQALVQARGADVTRSTAYQAQLSAEKSGAQVEVGGKLGKEKPLTEGERIRQSVFKAKDPADALFA